MNRWNVRIGTRMAAAFGVVVALMLCIVGIAMLEMRVMRQASADLSDNWLPSVQHVGGMNAAAGDLRVLEFQHVLNTDDAAMVRVESDMATVLDEFNRRHAAYLPLVSSAAERDLMRTLDDDWKRYLALHARVLELSRANQNAEAKAMLEGEADKLFKHVSKLLDDLVAVNAQGSREAGAAAEAAYSSAKWMMGGVTAFALILAMVLGLWVIRSITLPLRQAVEVAERVADGDLSVTVRVDRSDELGALQQAMDKMTRSLTDIVATVRAASDSIATGSDQIATGNADLSQRTEEQASSLEETAATMEQVGSTVQQNAMHVQHAERLAQDASGIAARGGEVMGQVVDTMKRIDEASHRIAEITAVIDSIAFQTNILALNAAVEAARAGEQGRGFAVVAGEVRTLAQRCALAAKDIRELIQTSAERVTQGTELADRAGDTMAQIVQAIQRVTAIMGEVAMASSEQSHGVAAVGNAVTQLDQVTQQNAALVEQSAAAAASLKQQARSLVEVVSVFRTHVQAGGDTSSGRELGWARGG